MSDRNNYNGTYNGQNGKNNYGEPEFNEDGQYPGLDQLFQGGNRQNNQNLPPPPPPPPDPNRNRGKATEPLPDNQDFPIYRRGGQVPPGTTELPPYVRAQTPGAPGYRPATGNLNPANFNAASNGTGGLPEPSGQRVLHGQMPAFSTSSLLSLLNIQKQTGYLYLSNGLTFGSIYVEKGEVFDAKLGSLTGALALFQLFGWKAGEFAFDVGVEAPEKRTIEASLPVLQVRATLWLDNWSKYNPIIPSTSHRISIAPEPRSEVVIEPYQWAVLTKIVARPMTITELASEIGQDLMDVTKIAADLVKMGVAVVYEPNQD